jgi:hypothetical protein
MFNKPAIIDNLNVKFMSNISFTFHGKKIRIIGEMGKIKYYTNYKFI